MKNMITNPKFQMPQERARASKRKFKLGIVTCLAFTCIITAQNIAPLSTYANPGINQNTKFVVAHACGGMNVEGRTKSYLNVVEAVDYHYSKGTRMFELDFVFSKEGELVGIHNYEYFNDYSNKNRIPFEEYIGTKILDKFHGMTSERLFELINKYPDAKFIVDTKEKDAFSVYEKLIEDAKKFDIDLKKSIVPFVVSKEMLEEIEKIYDFDELMFSNYKANLNTKDLLDVVCSNDKIKYLHIFPVDFFRIETNEFNKRGIRVFAHMDKDTLFQPALRYGCTGIFSDDITEEMFKIKYKYILDQKLTSAKTNINHEAFPETLSDLLDEHLIKDEHLVKTEEKII